MTIDIEIRTGILRTHRAEGRPVGNIARHLGIQHSIATRTLDRTRTSDGKASNRSQFQLDSIIRRSPTIPTCPWCIPANQNA